MSSRSLSGRLLVWILPLTFGAVVVAALSTYNAARKQIIMDAQRDVAGLARGAAGQVEAFFEQRRNDLAIISQSPLFRDQYMNVEYGLEQEASVYRRDIENMLLDFSRRVRVYPRLLYLDASGREVCRIFKGRAEPPQGDHAKADYFRAIKELPPGRFYASPAARVSWHDNLIVHYGTGLYDGAGRLRGELVFDCSLKPVYETLERMRGGSLRKVFLVGRQGSGALGAQVPPRGSGFLTAAEVAVGTPWSVAAVASRQDLLEGLHSIRMLAFLIGLIVTVFALLVIIHQIRSATQPIGELAEAAKAYAGGDWSVRVKAVLPNEVSSLSRAFNDMADNLQERTRDLEQRVQQLTALKRMNDAVLHQLGRREIGRTCLQAAVTGLGFDCGVLYWVYEDRGEIVGECVFGTEILGFTDDAIRRRRIPIDGGDILAHVVRERSTINVEDAEKDPRCNPTFLAEARARSFCLAPIIGRDRVLGIIGVDCRSSGKPVPAPLARSLSLFCSAAGLALENARLLDDIVSSEERYRAAVENSPDAVVGLDGNLLITLWNRRAEALFGYQPTEAYGRTLEFVLARADYLKIRRAVETQGAVRHAEAAGRTRDGRSLDLSVSWTGHQAGRNQAGEWFIVLQDITEKKRLQTQLIQAEKTSAVGNLISGVAHELNNPLAAVVGFAELIKDQPRGAKAREDLRFLYESALRCRDIVQGLLLFVRQEKPVIRRVALNRVAEATIALYEYRLVKTEGIKLEVELSPGSPEIGGEFQKIQQVMVNLLNNAIDVLKEWKGPRVVRLKTSKSRGWSIFEVEDTGPGVPEELQNRVFEPFFTTKPSGKGSGLGLSISAQIVREFSGELRCKAAPGGGARFVAYFPNCPKGLEQAPPPMHLPPPVTGKRVLVVDDEPDLLRLMLRLLREDGIEAVAAAGYQEALERVREEAFDLVIADIEMGSAKGTELFAESKNAPHRVNFLFVTGDILNRPLADLLSDWGVPYLTKPFLRTDFLRAVRKALKQPMGSAQWGG